MNPVRQTLVCYFLTIYLIISIISLEMEDQFTHSEVIPSII